MDRNTKIKTISLLTLAFIAIFLLSISLSHLTLQPGLPFVSGNEVGIKVGTVDTSSQVIPQFPLLQGLFALVFVIVVFLMFVNILSVINLKRIILIVLALGLLYGLSIILPKSAPQQEAIHVDAPVGLDYQSLTTFETTPLGTPPTGLIWMVLGGMIVGIVGLVWWRIRVFKRLNHKDEILQEAQQAIADLEFGQRFDDVIIRSYIKMSQALQEQRGIDRKQVMTAREFETLLVEKGVPFEPIHQLTRLFETVRYSPTALDESQQSLGLESLHAIVRYCKGQAE